VTTVFILHNIITSRLPLVASLLAPRNSNAAADLSMKNRRLARELNDFKEKNSQISRAKSTLHARNIKLESVVRSLTAQCECGARSHGAKRRASLL